MLTLITGLPGNAKTLHAIAFVKKWAERENRPVYYSGIPALTLDWQEIDPLKWFDVPAKAIVIIDECQKVFRNRSLGSVPGKHVTELETHRHLGIDLVFITQHPSLIDPAIRKLTQCHKHLVRIWGMEASTVHQWGEVRDNCDKPAGRKDSEKTKWGFDKSVYKLYKSSDEHTMKRSIPTRVKMLFILPFVLIALGYLVYSQMFGKQNVPGASPASSAALNPLGASVLPAPAVVAVAPVFDALADAKQFLAMSTPRVEGLLHTAPKYDDLTKPSTVPVPAMCVQSGDHGSKCKCYSQQGTPMDIKFSMCVGFAREGFFQDFNPDRDKKESLRTAESVKVLDGRQENISGSGNSNIVAFNSPSPSSADYPKLGSGAKF